MYSPRLILALLLLSSCNTCLNASSVPFDGSPRQDVSVEDAGTDADASEPADLDAPEQCEELDWCAEAGRVCGAFDPGDPCAPSDLDCGSCGDGGMCSDGQCECLAGFISSPQGCVDVDECFDGTDDCAQDEFCINEPGTFRCSDCPAGQQQGAMGCEDIDECATDMDDCDPLVTCTNLDPFFECGPCPAGYEDKLGDGTLCSDIDECADGTNNCDVNATCSNVVGSFDCACNSDYMGDGITCTPIVVPFVVSVTSVEVTIDDGAREASVALPVGSNASQLVPFATANLDGATDPDDGFVDVWVDVSAAELAVERDGQDGDVLAHVSLVEFHPSVTVQSGTFSLAGTSQNVAVANVNPAESFLVFTNTLSVGANRSAGHVAGEIMANNLVGFDRAISSGSVEGHFYVVSSPEITVTQRTLNVGATNLCGTNNLQATDSSRALLFYSFEGGSLSGGAANVLSTNCQVRTNDVRCCRGEINFVFPITVQLQLVEFGATSTAVVHRGDATINNFGTVATLPTAVDPLWSTALAGPSSLAGNAILTGTALDDDLAQVAAALNQTGTSIDLRRGDNGSSSATSYWQVIEWPH